MGLTKEQQLERDKSLANLKVTTYRDKKGYVFVSYKSDNWKEVFENKVFDLQKQGMRVYSDKNFDDTNRSWLDAMELNIKYSSVFLMFISEEYLQSYATLIELLTAIRYDKQIVPVYFEDKNKLFDVLDCDVDLEDKFVQMNPAETNRLEGLLNFIARDNKRRRFQDLITQIQSIFMMAQEKFCVRHIVESFEKILMEGDLQDNLFDKNIQSLIHTIKDAALSDQKYSGVFDENVEQECEQDEEIPAMQQEQVAAEAEELFFGDAIGVLDGDKGFILKKGSIINGKTASYCPEKTKKLREESIKNGELIPIGNDYQLTVDKVFRRASSAAAFVCGYNISASVAWKGNHSLVESCDFVETKAPKNEENVMKTKIHSVPLAIEPICDDSITIGHIRKFFEDAKAAFLFREVRESMPRGGKGAMDYAMTAILGGCNAVKVGSPLFQINYYTYVVADYTNKKADGGLGATWTWSSNCRKVLGLEKAGQIPNEIDDYFKQLPENTTLRNIEQAFIDCRIEAYQTKKNEVVVEAIHRIFDFFSR